METEIKYKKFRYDKSIDELYYNSSLWVSELKFIAIELPFIKDLIQSYPFKSKTPNLFERIQLFTKEFDIIEKERTNILDKILKHQLQLNGMLECNDLSCDNYYILEHENLAKQVFNYLHNYKKNKTQVYEFMDGITNDFKNRSN